MTDAMTDTTTGTEATKEPAAETGVTAEAAPLPCLDQKTLDAIITSLGRKPSEEDCLVRLKSTWPMFRFIFCDDDDLGEKEPFWQSEYFSIHLIAASLGCGSFTYQPDQAAGMVIGIIYP